MSASLSLPLGRPGGADKRITGGAGVAKPNRQARRAGGSRREEQSRAPCDRAAGHAAYIPAAMPDGGRARRRQSPAQLGCAAAKDGARAWLGAWRLAGRAKEGGQASERREARQTASIRRARAAEQASGAPAAGRLRNSSPRRGMRRGRAAAASLKSRPQQCCPLCPLCPHAQHQLEGRSLPAATAAQPAEVSPPRARDMRVAASGRPTRQHRCQAGKHSSGLLCAAVRSATPDPPAHSHPGAASGSAGRPSSPRRLAAWPVPCNNATIQPCSGRRSCACMQVKSASPRCAARALPASGESELPPCSRGSWAVSTRL